MKERSEGLTYFLILIAMMIYGLSFIGTKMALQCWGPISIIFIRLFISTALLFAVDRFINRKNPAEGRLRKGDLKYFFLMAFLEPFIYFLAENYGLRSISASVASIIIGTMPVITPIFSFFILKEKLTLFGLFGILLSFGGVMLAVMSDRFSPEFSTGGLILMIVAVLCAVGYTISVKFIPLKYKPVTIVKYQNLIGGMLMLPLFLGIDSKTFFSTPPLPEAVIWVLFLAVLPSGLAFILFSYSIRRLGPNRANVFTNTVPIFTLFFAFLLLDESITLLKVVGMFAVIAGVFISQIPGARAKFRAFS
jgi:drug/metabolite transporter (DMT)-like permease